MSSLLRVATEAEKEAFVDALGTVYQAFPNFVPPPRAEVQSLFASLEPERVERWILRDSTGKVTGCVAAYLPHGAEEGGLGALGFYACATNEGKQLLDAASEWLQQRGASGVDGPVNFGERDRFWGLLVHGFERPVFLENYHPPGALQAFTDAGFVPHRESVTYAMSLLGPVPPRLERVEAWALRHKKFRTECFSSANPMRFLDGILPVYSASFRSEGRVRALESDDVLERFAPYVEHVASEGAWLCRTKEDVPVGAFVCMTNLNDEEKRSCKGLFFAVIPTMQARGVDALLAAAAWRANAAKQRYDEIYAAGISGQSAKMHKLLSSIGARVVRIHLTLRRSFDARTTIEQLPMPFFTAL